MKFKNIILISMFLLVIFTINAVSATDNITDTVEETLQENPSQNLELSKDSNEELISLPQEDNVLKESKNWYVDVSSSSSMQDGSKQNPFKTFKSAYESADNGDTINIAPGVYTGFDNMCFTIEKELTIQGTGKNVIFDGGGGMYTIDKYGHNVNPRLFQIYASNTVIEGITFQNAKSDGDGAVLSIIYSSCTIRNCKFINNHGGECGGAIYVYKHEGDFWGYNNQIINCEFIGNTATKGGAIYWHGNKGNLISSTFTSNTAAFGGAVLMDSNQGTITSCTFTSNTADSYGGAICWVQENGCLKESKFENNNGNAAGAVFWDGNNGQLTKSTFTNNVAYNGGAIFWNGDNGQLSASTFNYNIGKSKGDSVYWQGEYGIISNCNAYTTGNKENNIILDTFLENVPKVTGFNVYVVDPNAKNPSNKATNNAKKTPKLIVKKATFKAKTKTKKFKVLLKTDKNKALQKVKLYLKVNGKTYNAKTNSKGKATFKVKLKKKGTYNAQVTFKGNSNFNKITKKAKIIIK